MTTTAQKLNKTLLGEIADITSSKRIFASDYVSEGIPFYRSREVIERQKGNDISTELYISKEKFESIKNKFGVPKKDDLLITSVGTLGVPYVVGENEVFYFKDGNLIWLRDFKKNIASPKFIYYAILNPETQQRLKGISIGSSQSAFTISALKDFYVLLPDISFQEKVVDILASYDSLIENNARRIQILEQVAQVIYQEAFASTNGKSVPLGEAIKIHRGKSYGSHELSETDGIPFVNLKCIDRDGGFRKSGLKRFTGNYKDTHKVVAGDIVMAVTDMTQDRRIVARAARVPTLEGGFGVISMDLVKIEPKNGSDKDYIYSLLRWSGFADEVKNHANGANVLHLIPDRITDYKTAIASPKKQKEFGDAVNPLLDLIDKLELQNESLRRSRDLLLPKLVTGEIKI